VEILTTLYLPEYLLSSWRRCNCDVSNSCPLSFLLSLNNVHNLYHRTLPCNIFLSFYNNFPLIVARYSFFPQEINPSNLLSFPSTTPNFILCCFLHLGHFTKSPASGFFASSSFPYAINGISSIYLSLYESGGCPNSLFTFNGFIFFSLKRGACRPPFLFPPPC